MVIGHLTLFDILSKVCHFETEPSGVRNPLCAIGFLGGFLSQGLGIEKTIVSEFCNNSIRHLCR